MARHPWLRTNRVVRDERIRGVNAVYEPRIGVVILQRPARRWPDDRALFFRYCVGSIKCS